MKPIIIILSPRKEISHKDKIIQCLEEAKQYIEKEHYSIILPKYEKTTLIQKIVDKDEVPKSTKYRWGYKKISDKMGIKVEKKDDVINALWMVYEDLINGIVAEKISRRTGKHPKDIQQGIEDYLEDWRRRHQV